LQSSALIAQNICIRAFPALTALLRRKKSFRFIQIQLNQEFLQKTYACEELVFQNPESDDPESNGMTHWNALMIQISNRNLFFIKIEAEPVAKNRICKRSTYVVIQ